MDIVTFPYYRTYRSNTLQPIELIARYTTQPRQINKLLYHLDRWQTRKLAELQFISIAISSIKSILSAISEDCVRHRLTT